MKKLAIATASSLCLASCSQGEPTAAAGNQAAIPSSQPSQAQSPLGDGPFGLSMGAAVDSLQGFTPGERPHIYRTSSPPKAHPDFSEVVVVAYPGAGICLIRGVGANIPNDGAGLNIRSKVDELARALQTRYGPGRKVNTCAGSDVACEEQFWMMTLSQNERTYAHVWETQNEAMRKARIGDIYIGAQGAGIDASFPMIEYSSADRKTCAQAAASAGAEAL
jgi:hypothetical protein